MFDYYIVYDNDMVVCYLDNFLELVAFTDKAPKELNRKFNDSRDNSICVILKNKKYKIFKYLEV